DRFRFDDVDGRGTWICSQCGAGDGFALAMLVTGVPFADLAVRVESVVGKAATRMHGPVHRPEDDEWRHARYRAQQLWRESRRVSEGDPVSRWLAHRVGQAEAPSSLRYHPAMPY